VKYAAAALLIVLLGFCSPAVGHSQDNLTQSLLKIPLESPIAAHSAIDLVQEGRRTPDPNANASVDSFDYVLHHRVVVTEGLRVIIFVPHPDDESIACSGLIQRVLEKGGKVCLVFVTNGDGYVEAVRLRVNNTRITPKDFVEYGKRRQEEATQAVCQLGLQPEDLVFLGFPDDGIDDLWESYWSNLKPFISPYTLFDRPHRKGLNRWVKYSGVALNEEMERVLNDFAPDWIVLPDPRDQHPDHSTAGVFVLGALRDIYQEGKDRFNPTQILTYLVHYKDYPHGTEWARKIGASGVGTCATSGKTLADTEWLSLPLTPEEMEGKRRALVSHSSQLAMLGPFFKYFLQPSELFGRLNMMQVIAVPQEYAAYFKHPPEESENKTLVP
jgi:N-acetyl-1-D-myo-inositol-2-amino-2-deoxy-alpha-D-glucopyranoside deacetylase